MAFVAVRMVLNVRSDFNQLLILRQRTSSILFLGTPELIRQRKISAGVESDV
jgi:hypothetical protein